MKRFFACAWLLILMLVVFSSCQQKPAPVRRTGNSTLSFNSLANIRFTEVRREFENGYAFNAMGFEQIPEWVMYFLPGDSVKIYNPSEKKFIHFPIYFDHANVFNTARQWFRLHNMNRDSLTLQLLQVEDKKVSKYRSNVYMKFYSEGYLQKAGSKQTKKLLRRDSIYVQKLSQRANRNAGNLDSAFAATQPVLLKSIKPNIQVEHIKPDTSLLNDYRASDEYMNPAYDITIKNAYRDFFYEFGALVDDKGLIYFAEMLTFAEDIESRKSVLNGIIKVYLQPGLQVIAGSTLGYPHTSEISLKIRGIKSK